MLETAPAGKKSPAVARRANAAARKRPLDLAECGVESFSVQPTCIGPAICLMTWPRLSMSTWR
jgi:hypothetical protein